MSHVIPTQEIQSLVFSGYGRLSESMAIGLAARDRVEARAGLRAVVESEVSFGLSRGTRSHAVQLLLSAAGIRGIDLHPSRVAEFSAGFQQGIIAPQRSRALGDAGKNDPRDWKWQDQQVQALLLLYAKDGPALSSLRSRLLGRLAHGWTPVFELPICLPPDNREPFGFRDGISSSRIDLGDGSGAEPGFDLLPPGEVLFGHEDADGVVRPPPALGIDGAYLVVRQLEQDVQGFWKSWRAQAGSDVEAVWLASKALGRWPNGMPMRSDAPEPPPASVEDEVLRALSFDGDRAGRQCPVGAHIRRANPRDALLDDPKASRELVSHHRIIRRGRMYGPPAPADWYPPLLERPVLSSDAPLPDSARGLLFMCLCADLERQFEFIQQTWLNNPKFSDRYEESDAVGAGDGVPGNNHCFSIPGCPMRRRLTGVQGWVTVRGGGYFLLPGRRAFSLLLSD